MEVGRQSICWTSYRLPWWRRWSLESRVINNLGSVCRRCGSLLEIPGLPQVQKTNFVCTFYWWLKGGDEEWRNDAWEGKYDPRTIDLFPLSEAEKRRGLRDKQVKCRHLKRKTYIHSLIQHPLSHRVVVLLHTSEADRSAWEEHGEVEKKNAEETTRISPI